MSTAPDSRKPLIEEEVREEFERDRFDTIVLAGLALEGLGLSIAVFGRSGTGFAAGVLIALLSLIAGHGAIILAGIVHGAHRRDRNSTSQTRSMKQMTRCLALYLAMWLGTLIVGTIALMILSNFIYWLIGAD